MIVLSSPRAAVIGIWMLTQCGFHPVRTALVGLSGAATGLLPFAPIVRTDSPSTCLSSPPVVGGHGAGHLDSFSVAVA